MGKLKRKRASKASRMIRELRVGRRDGTSETGGEKAGRESGGLPTALSLEDRRGPDAARKCRLWSRHPAFATKHGFLPTGDGRFQKCRGGGEGASQLGEENVWHGDMGFGTSSLGS